MVKRSSKRNYIFEDKHMNIMIIVEAMLATVQEEFHITDEQIECFYNKFMSKLPESMQRLL